MKARDRGLFHRKGSPNWYIRFSDENGKIVKVSTGTVDKNLARNILGKKKTQVAEGRCLDIKKVPSTTFFELCGQYWKLWGSHLKTRGLASMLGDWKCFFGNIPVKSINRHKVEIFLIEKMTGGKRKLTPATRNRHLAYLSSMFNKGKEWGLLTDNPALGIKLLKENGARTRFLDQVEIQSLLTVSGKEFQPVLITVLHTGMRKGEIRKLEWSDVDFHTKVITIRESKSGRSRIIPIDNTLYKTLVNLPSRFKGGLVFPSSHKEGRPYFDFKSHFKFTVEEAKIENFRFHDLRHTFASHLVMNGVDLLVVKELLGHQSLTMTEKYAHLAPDHRSRAIRTLDRAFKSGTKTDSVEKSGSYQSR